MHSRVVFSLSHQNEIILVKFKFADARLHGSGMKKIHAYEFVTIEDVDVDSVKKFAPWAYFCNDFAVSLVFENEYFLLKQLESIF